MMDKKGAELVPTLVVIFVILLIVLFFIVGFMSKGFTKFSGGSEQAQDEFYKCYCKPFGSSNACEPSEPAGYGAREPLSSCGKWVDCEFTCWEKQ